jgi:hypothetical protein
LEQGDVSSGLSRIERLQCPQQPEAVSVIEGVGVIVQEPVGGGAGSVVAFGHRRPSTGLAHQLLLGVEQVDEPPRVW